MVEASGSRSVDLGSASFSSHTKDLKNCAHSFPVWRSAIEVMW